MKLFQKNRNFRSLLASANRSITGKENSKYPRINLFMAFDNALFCVAGIAMLFMLAKYSCSTERYSDVRDYITTVIPVLVVWCGGLHLSFTAAFKVWDDHGFQKVLICFMIVGAACIIIQLNSSPGPDLPALFCINLFSTHIEMDILLVVTYITIIGWYINSIRMLRYKLRLHRHLCHSNSHVLS